MSSSTDAPNSSLAAVAARLEAVAARLEAISPTGCRPAAAAAAAAVVASPAPASCSSSAVAGEFRSQVCGAPLDAFLASAKQLGGHVQLQAEQIAAAFRAVADAIAMAAEGKLARPASSSDPAFSAAIAPIVAAIGQIDSLAGPKAPREQGDHVAAARSGNEIFTWLPVEVAKPSDIVKSALESADYYILRVRRQHASSPPQIAWANSYKELLTAACTFVSTKLRTGLPYGAGKAAGGAAPATSPAASASASAAASKPAAPAIGGALFSQISGASTSGLKKVEKSEMTHKNPALRASSVVSASAPSSVASTATTSSAAVKTAGAPVVKPPRMAFEGNRWNVEHQRGARDLKIEVDRISHSVYIYDCEDTQIHVVGKCNMVQLDRCKRTAVVIDSLLSSIDMVNSTRIEVQVTGSVPTISIDTTDGVNVYLARSSVATEILTTKSSIVNINYPPTDDKEADYVERPIPEQMKTVISPCGTKLETSIIIHKG